MQDMRGNIAASALILGVVTAVVVSTLSETNSLPIEGTKPKVTIPSSPSPSKKPTPTPKSTHTATPHLEAMLSMKPIVISYSKNDVKKWTRQKIGSQQFSCVNNLWMHESEWNMHAVNDDSGAYGIPQSLPGRKMQSKGSDWKTNPYTQVKWGLSYINSRYGSPCNAWNHFQTAGWY